MTLFRTMRKKGQKKAFKFQSRRMTVKNKTAVREQGEVGGGKGSRTHLLRVLGRLKDVEHPKNCRSKAFRNT